MVGKRAACSLDSAGSGGLSPFSLQLFYLPQVFLAGGLHGGHLCSSWWVTSANQLHARRGAEPAADGHQWGNRASGSAAGSGLGVCLALEAQALLKCLQRALLR